MDPATRKELRSLCRDEADFRRAQELFAAQYPGCGYCRQRFRLTFDHAPLGMAICDGERRIVSANAALATALGRDAGELAGVDLTDLTEPAGRATLTDILDRVAAGGIGGARLATRYRRADGSELWGQTTVNAIADEDDGQVILLLVMIEDVTELRQAEKLAREQDRRLRQAEKLASLGTLIAGVAHEINNPNHVIAANLGRLRQAWDGALPVLDEYRTEHGDFVMGGLEYSALREHLPRLVADIDSASRRIRHLVQDLLTFSRPLAVDADDGVDLNAVAMVAIEAVGTTVAGSGIELRVELAPLLPPVRGCRRRLEQVLVNLLQNACQASVAPGGVVTVRTAAAEGGGTVEVEVVDQGRGIAAEILDRVCDPFFTTRRDDGGTGLGLWIVAAIVEEHAGRLDIDSLPGRGTTVRIRLPAQREATP
jgi:PAS domain S-box-containing protein